MRMYYREPYVFARSRQLMLLFNKFLTCIALLTRLLGSDCGSLSIVKLLRRFHGKGDPDSAVWPQSQLLGHAFLEQSGTDISQPS